MTQRVKLGPGWSPRLLTTSRPCCLAAARLFSLIVHMGISLKIFFEVGSGHRGTCSLSSSSLTKTDAVPLPAIPYRGGHLCLYIF